MFCQELPFPSTQFSRLLNCYSGNEKPNCWVFCPGTRSVTGLESHRRSRRGKAWPGAAREKGYWIEGGGLMRWRVEQRNARQGRGSRPRQVKGSQGKWNWGKATRVLEGQQKARQDLENWVGKDTEQAVRQCEVGEARQSKGMVRNGKEMQDWVGKAKQCKGVVDKAVRVFRGPS